MEESYLNIAKQLMVMAQKVRKKELNIGSIPFDSVVSLIDSCYKKHASSSDSFILNYGNILSQGLAHEDEMLIANCLELISNHISMLYKLDIEKMNREIEKYKLTAEITHMMNCRKNELWYQHHSEQKNYIPFEGRGVVYCAVTGGYDNIYEPEYISPNLDYILFTDNSHYKSDVWQVRYLDNLEKLDNVRLARKVKIFPHMYLKDYDYSIWVDGKLKIVEDMEEYKNTYRKNESMLCCSHYANECIYEELEACVHLKKDDEDLMRTQVTRYRSEGYPEKNGLIDSALLVRDHHDERLKQVMETWWKEIVSGSRRDQLSFNYSCWKNNYIYDTSGLFIYDNKYVQLMGHN